MDKISLVDVGARGGIHPRWAPYYGLLDVTGFEPDAVECAALNRRKFPYSARFLPYALGAIDGQQATLHVCRSPGCSSLLEPDTAFCDGYPYGDALHVVRRETITLMRMDTVCGDLQPDVMKIDTQGSEISVMEGAGRMLDGVLAVELEVEFVPQYRNQPLFAHVDGFMRDHGFTLRGLRRTYWREKATYTDAAGGQLIHGDALYLRPDRMNTEQGHVILLAYRQHDLLARFGAGRKVPSSSWARRALSTVLSGYSHRELRRFVDSMRPADATDWHDPDFF